MDQLLTYTLSTPRVSYSSSDGEGDGEGDDEGGGEGDDEGDSEGDGEGDDEVAVLIPTGLPEWTSAALGDTPSPPPSPLTQGRSCLSAYVTSSSSSTSSSEALL